MSDCPGDRPVICELHEIKEDVVAGAVLARRMREPGGIDVCDVCLARGAAASNSPEMRFVRERLALSAGARSIVSVPSFRAVLLHERHELARVAGPREESERHETERNDRQAQARFRDVAEH